MFVTGIGTAAPENRFTQRECYEAVEVTELFASLKPRSRAIIKKILLGDNGIETRHFCVKRINETFEMTPDILQSRFLENAPALAASAAERALVDAGCSASEIDAVIISTCTGYLCPGLTSYVAERLGLRPDIFTVDLVGQGCGAAIPNLRTAEALLAGGRAEKVLSICVEVCSAAMYIDDDPGVLVSACLFGDGAGAAVLSSKPIANKRNLEWTTADSLLEPQHRDKLRFEHRNGMLRNILSVDVPSLAANAVGKLLTQSLARQNLSQQDITTWILHAGGKEVLNALRKKLELAPDDLRHSEAVLREYGNLSSSSVYFTLQNALATNTPHGWWWMCSFGAGFSCGGALLKVG